MHSQEMWLVETPGKTANPENTCILNSASIGPRPASAQIIGTITFGRSEQYENRDCFLSDSEAHRVRAGGTHDRMLENGM